MATSLREIINQRILNDVVKACRVENEYKVLEIVWKMDNLLSQRILINFYRKIKFLQLSSLIYKVRAAITKLAAIDTES